MASLYEKLVQRIYHNGELKVDDTVPILGNQDIVDDMGIIQFLDRVKEVSYKRKDRLDLYDTMSKDPLIAAALNLYADESITKDRKSNKSFWVASSDKKLEKELNDWLENTINLDYEVWKWAFNLAKNGEIYLRTFETEKDPLAGNMFKVGDYFEMVQNTQDVAALELYGQVIGYQYKTESKKTLSSHSGMNISSDNYITNPVEFIHMSIDRGERERVLAQVNVNGQRENRECLIPIGYSVLEDCRQAWQILDMIENIIVISRMSRSQFYRIFNVEVGAAGKVETNRILSELKRAINTKESIDAKSAYKSASRPLPINSNIYIPTRQNKGEIRLDSVGGDIDVKDLVDLDYFANKFFAALGIPKAYLNFDTNLGWDSGGSLARLDIRFARGVQRIKVAIASGLLEMCVFKAKKMGYKEKDLKNLIRIEMSQITTADEEEQLQKAQAEMQLAETLVQTIATNFPDLIDNKALLDYILNEVLSLFNVQSIIGEGDGDGKPSGTPPQETK